MFGVFCFANGLFALFFIPETKRMSLEEIDILFGNVDTVQRTADIEMALQAEKKELNIELVEERTS